MLEPLDIPDGYFEYLFPKKEWECLHRAMQRVFAEETGDGNIKITLVKAKGG